MFVFLKTSYALCLALLSYRENTAVSILTEREQKRPCCSRQDFLHTTPPDSSNLDTSVFLHGGMTVEMNHWITALLMLEELKHKSQKSVQCNTLIVGFKI